MQTATLDITDQAWKLLGSVSGWRRSAPTRSVNVVVEDLYAKYPNVDALAEAQPEEIEAIVKPCGLREEQGARHQCLYADPA